MRTILHPVRLGALVVLSIAFTACQKNVNTVGKNTSANDQMSSTIKSSKGEIDGITFYALAGNTLDQYSTSDPERVIGSVMITGLQSGEQIVGIDFRPATGELFALGSKSRIYVIDPSTGNAKFIAALTTIPMGSTTAVPLSLSGTSFGVDFNPAVDRIRIVSNTGQNLRVNPTNGVTIVDGSINPQPASVNAVAYDNNDRDPGTGTELYALDISSKQLFEIDPPNNGTLIDPLEVKLKITGDGGFDIAPRSANVTSDIGLALYEVNKKSTLFSIDVETGDTKILAKYNKAVMYTAIAIR